ncbi:AMP-binding protein [Pseudonocardia sp. WMMC193]|uniref:AMP-binding protein n=1 Tax=Pseudonocardia sp. WMMC193 TaxID=2911965 RepID=UPI0035AB813A
MAALGPVVTRLRRDGGTDTCSFGSLVEAVGSLTAGLRALGVGPGDLVVTRFGESPVAAVVHLAVWRLGGRVVPCAPVETARELRFILEDTEQAAVIGGSEDCSALVEALREHPLPVTTIGHPEPVSGGTHTVASVDAGQPTHSPVHPTTPLDSSGIHYTGGTTGVPEDACATHVAEIAPADLTFGARRRPRRRLPLPRADRARVRQRRHDQLPLRAGARAVYLEAPTPEAMWQAVEEHGVSLLAGAATRYRTMLRAAPSGPQGRCVRPWARARCSTRTPPWPGTARWACPCAAASACPRCAPPLPGVRPRRRRCRTGPVGGLTAAGLRGPPGRPRRRAGDRQRRDRAARGAGTVGHHLLDHGQPASPTGA